MHITKLFTLSLILSVSLTSQMTLSSKEKNLNDFLVQVIIQDKKAENVSNVAFQH